MTRYRKLIHPDFLSIAIKIPFGPGIIRLASLVQVWLRRTARLPAAVHRRNITIKSEDKAIPAELFEPSDDNRLLPCVFFIHGGGFGYEIAPHHLKLACYYVMNADCRILMPDYRLLPKNPFPAAYNDIMAAYKWLCENADELKIDINKIAVMGDSAGGALAANLCNTAEKHNLPLPCFQMLIYPVTDAEMTSESMKKYSDTPGWSAPNNKKMWKMYLKGASAEAALAASPMQNELPGKLPDTFIETAEFDCLRDEALLYAEKLKKAGAKLELSNTKRTIHGYDSAFKKPETQKNVRIRLTALQKAFEK